MYFLQQLHEHEIKGTFFIFFLNIGSEVEVRISSGKVFQSWLALYAMLSKPNVFVLGFWDWNIWKFLRLFVFSLSLKMSLMISGDWPFRYLWTSTIRSSLHFWWTGFAFEFSRSTSKSEVHFFWVRRRHHSYMLVILPIECFVQNFHNKGQ